MKRLLSGSFLLPFAIWLVCCTSHIHSTKSFSHIEEIIANAPDSALNLLQNTPSEWLNNRATRAQYALLYAEASDRAQTGQNNDSLLLIARQYYRERPHDTRNLCKTLFYQGKSKLRQGDKPGALRLFLEVEEKLRRIDEPYYQGLLYLRIGEVYHAELNFVRAYRYFRDARDLFIRSGKDRQTAEALLGMTASALRMRDLGRARRDCTMALELADELRDDTLMKRSLGYFATLYTVSETERIPSDLLQRIEQAVHGDTTALGLCTQAQTQLLQNRLDSACHYLKLAEKRTENPDDMPMLFYTAYRIDLSAKRYPEATQHIHRFIFLNDSLTRTALQASAGMIEKDYFRERSAFADYRIQNRRTWESVIALAIILLAGIAGYVIWQRIRLHKERNERYLLLVREAQSEYQKLSRHMAQKDHAETRLKGFITSRFDIVYQLGKTLYERENTVSGQAVMVRQVKQLIDGFTENGEMLQELEQIVDMAHDNAMQKLRNNFPKMKQSDIRLLCYIFGGFSPQVISLFMDDTVANIYARKSRLKSRIKASDAPDKELFITLLG